MSLARGDTMAAMPSGQHHNGRRVIMAMSVLISVRETARIFGVHRDTVYRWIQAGTLTALDGRTDVKPLYRIDTDDIAILLRRWGAQEERIRKLLAPYLSRS